MRNRNIHILLVLMVVLSVSLVVWPKASARSEETGVTWQAQSSCSIRLGIRDKYGDLGNYKALFVVKDGKGNKMQQIISVHGSDPGAVYYSDGPDDSFTFPTNWTFTGNYSWVCIVNNKVVAGGKFSKTQIGTVEQVRTYQPFNSF